MGKCQVLILLYHRVTELPIDPQLLAVTPQHFSEHLDVLRKDFHPLSLRELIERMETGRLPSRATVVTFDDGYSDNLGNAKPLLNRHDVPATVFVTTGYVGGDREFWWDEVERLLLHGRKLPGVLHLRINGTDTRWELGSDAEPADGWFQKHRDWNVAAQESQGGSRHHVYASLCRLLRPLAPDAREKALDALRDWAGANAAGRPTHRPMSPEEIAQLAHGSRIEVGAHTVTHPVLAALPVEAQRQEIVRSKTRLEDMVNAAVTSFSYPFGTLSDYSAATVDCVRRAGFACACANVSGLVGPRTDRFALPRLVIRDWDGDTLARHVAEAFDA